MMSPSERLEVAERGGEEGVPEACGLGEVQFAGGGEVGLVLAGGDDLALDVLGELGLEDRVGELLQQDGREVQIAVQADAIGLQPAQDAQQRQVGLGGGFVQPLHAVRPGAVVDDVGQMSVQRKGEKASRLRRRRAQDVVPSGY